MTRQETRNIQLTFCGLIVTPTNVQAQQVMMSYISSLFHVHMVAAITHYPFNIRYISNDIPLSSKQLTGCGCYVYSS